MIDHTLHQLVVIVAAINRADIRVAAGKVLVKDNRIAREAVEFAAKSGGERDKWQLTREDQVLLVADTVMIPDFTFTHCDTGQQVIIETVGFRHPEYLRRKLEKVRAAKLRNLILLVYEGVNLSADRLRDVPGEVLYFKNKPVLKEVLAAVERTASRS